MPRVPAYRSAARLPKGSTTADAPDLREHILQIASSLFYNRGVRAVGVDLVVDEARIAKTSLYRYFPTKDDLIVAFLEREDVDFWGTWDAVAAGRIGVRSVAVRTGGIGDDALLGAGYQRVVDDAAAVANLLDDPDLLGTAVD